MTKKIVLLGYMGSGKSTIGRILAEKTNTIFIDLDKFIEEKEQKSVAEIFKLHGEIYFRKKESKYLIELLDNKTSMVLALGGGTPCFGNNMKIINQATPYVFYLHLPAKRLCERLIPEKNHRPLIAHLPDDSLEEFINKHLFERNLFYTQAHKIIKTENLSTAKIVSAIQEQL